MFVARKDDDKIKNVSHISMSSEQLTVASTASYANYNFVNQHQSKTANNLILGSSNKSPFSEIIIFILTTPLYSILFLSLKKAHKKGTPPTPPQL